MSIISKPDLRAQTKIVYDTIHPTKGEGIIINVIHCNPKEKPKAIDLESFRFFPNNIPSGFIYQKSQPYGTGTGLDKFCDEHGLEDVELSELITRVTDYTSFKKYRWHDTVEGLGDSDVDLEQDDKNSNRYRLHVRVIHTTGHNGVLVKETPFTFSGPWITASSVEHGIGLAWNAWKNHSELGFFATFPGCNCHCNSAPAMIPDK